MDGTSCYVLHFVYFLESGIQILAGDGRRVVLNQLRHLGSEELAKTVSFNIGLLENEVNVSFVHFHHFGLHVSQETSCLLRSEARSSYHSIEDNVKVKVEFEVVEEKILNLVRLSALNIFVLLSVKFFKDFCGKLSKLDRLVCVLFKYYHVRVTS